MPLPDQQDHSRLAPESPLEELIESVPDATLIVNDRGEIVLANAQTERMFGYSRGELLGQKVEVLLPERTQEKHVQHRIRFMSTPEIRPMGIGSELYGMRKDGTEIPVDISLSPLFRRAGTVVLCAVRDISSLKQAERKIQAQAEKLARANEKLERSNKELNDFASVLAHDLQAPLNHLTRFSELLAADVGEDLNDSAKEDLAFIENAAKHMRKMVKQMLEFARAGNKEIYKQRISLLECVDQILTFFSFRIEETNAEIIIDALPEVEADPQMIGQVFQNLIGNALKFVDESKPVVQITVEETEGETVLGVKDNGIGIAPEYAKEIFSPFRRLHGSGQYEGTGIGLATCEKIIARHGGRIWVESEPGSGAHFKFTIPRE